MIQLTFKVKKTMYQLKKELNISKKFFSNEFFIVHKEKHNNKVIKNKDNALKYMLKINKIVSKTCNSLKLNRRYMSFNI